jgi:hypothetical protein
MANHPLRKGEKILDHMGRTPGALGLVFVLVFAVVPFLALLPHFSDQKYVISTSYLIFPSLYSGRDLTKSSSGQ